MSYSSVLRVAMTAARGESNGRTRQGCCASTAAVHPTSATRRLYVTHTEKRLSAPCARDRVRRATTRLIRARACPTIWTARCRPTETDEMRQHLDSCRRARRSGGPCCAPDQHHGPTAPAQSLAGRSGASARPARSRPDAYLTQPTRGFAPSTAAVQRRLLSCSGLVRAAEARLKALTRSENGDQF